MGYIGKQSNPRSKASQFGLRTQSMFDMSKRYVLVVEDN